MMLSDRLFAHQAWLPGGWTDNVLLIWNAEGLLQDVIPGVQAPAECECADLVIPGMPNLHSHAFQRAMAGLTEYRANPSDSFWSWRTLMYDFAQRLTPDHVYSIALQLYSEMLEQGYTSVCEFHYLHHDTGGVAYANRAEMAACLVRAAQDAGIGLTLLPVLYQYGGFGARAPHEGQARFINSPEWIMGALESLQAQYPQHSGLRYGVAPHSLRAVSRDSLLELTQALHQWDASAPIHIHIAEQEQEVRDSIVHSGLRPVQWLYEHFNPDHRWCLVHATHLTSDEIGAIARSGAVAGICPTTEANLGDGIFEGPAYQQHQGMWGIGSDSHISVDLAEELRLFEYSQRLRDRQRNVLASEHYPSVGTHLFTSALAGGARASARPVAGLASGQRADLISLDANHSNLAGKPREHWFDSLVFARHGSGPIRDVLVGGHWVVRERSHVRGAATRAAYRACLSQLLTR